MILPDNQVKSGTILVVDDHLPNRELLDELLSSQGFKVVTAADGREALQQLRRQSIDLVLLDVMMPHLNGFQLCARIKADPDTCLIPVILVTALSDRQDRLDGIKAGADDFLTRPIDHAELLARVTSSLRLKQRTDELERAESVLFSLAQSIEGKDPYTHGHCERLSDLSAGLAQHLGLPDDQVLALRRAGVVHDIGKIAIPDSILLKPSSLSADEWKIVREHPIIGERICRPLKSFRNVLPIIRHHHERLDGSGYPDGLIGDGIPMTARVLQIVDVFDALTTERPYKPAFPIDRALETMRSEIERGWWDPLVFDEFVEFIHGDTTNSLPVQPRRELKTGR